MRKAAKHFIEEFKQDVINYYFSSGKAMDAVANELKVSKSLIIKIKHRVNL
jgi:transposase